MDIILEHGSTEDDELKSTEVSQKIVEPIDNQEENTSDSSDSSNSSKMLIKTKCNSQKDMRKDINREEADSSYSSDSENEIKKQKNKNFDYSEEYDSISIEKCINENLGDKNACTSNSRTDKNKSQNQPNVDGKYNSKIISES